MGLIFAIVPSRATWHGQVDALFARGVACAVRLWGRQPQNRAESPLARLATFSRENQSGGMLVMDPRKQMWMGSIGTWLHEHGYGNGNESWLLDAFHETDAVGVAKQLEGWFGLLVGHERDRTVTVITDAVGNCHLFMRRIGSLTAISNSSLLLAMLEEPSLDLLACQEFLEVGMVGETRTLFKTIEKLEGGSVYVLKDGEVEQRIRYWCPSQLVPNRYCDETAVEKLWESLTNASKRIHARYEKPVCDLTGGYDSRTLLAAFMSESVPVTTTVSGAPDHPDVRIAKRVASGLGVPCLHLEYREPYTWSRLERMVPLTDGECNLVEYAGIHEIHQHLLSYDVSINGSFGGLARGLWWEILGSASERKDAFPSRQLIQQRYLTQAIDRTLLAPSIAVDLFEHLAGWVDRVVEPVSQYPLTFQMDVANLALRIQRWQGRLASSTNRIHPCLSPFGLRSVLEVVLQTAAATRRHNRLIQHMLSRYAVVFTQIPLADGSLPQPISWRNWWKAMPDLRYLARRAIRKATSMAGLARTSALGSSREATIRISLWQDPDFRDLLDPRTMRSAPLCDEGRLARFLQQSQQTAFPYETLWQRLVSLEVTLQVFKRHGSVEEHRSVIASR
ncbi:MAG: hypothetical protein D6690_01570 [Nitrospirae bacterium]|nr:MAG: hypothetical protein D6690_01570 [Nitrospirota bacterium]